MMRTFVAIDYFDIKGRGRVWTGDSPITFDRDTEYQQLLGEWMIDHPEAEAGYVYTVTAVEMYCIRTIHKGAPIGLLTRN